MVRRGLVPSRERAATVIDAGRVVVAGAPATKAARLVSAAEPVEVLQAAPAFVGRGGEKLEAALVRFRLDVTGLRSLDAGASTGGFVDCLLQRGAAEVVAVDVGHGQLHPRLRGHPRVMVMERTNIRHLDLAAVGGSPFQVVVADLSFISLRAVAAVLVGLAAPGAVLVPLVKPQFEAGRAAVSKGRGVVRQPSVWLEALESVASAFAGAGAVIMGAMPSPITGASGNVEFLLHAVVHPSPGSAPGAPPGRPALEAAVEEAARLHGGKEAVRLRGEQEAVRLRGEQGAVGLHGGQEAVRLRGTR